MILLALITSFQDMLILYRYLIVKALTKVNIWDLGSLHKYQMAVESIHFGTYAP